MSNLFKLTFLTLALLLASNLFAASTFEGTQDGITRTSKNLEGGRIEDLEIASNGNLYAGMLSANGMFCSTDGAATWSGPPTGSDFGTVSAVEVGNTANTVFVIGGISLYKSTDACQTFTHLTPSGGGSGNFNQTMAYGTGTLLVAYRDGTIERSTDNGSTFTSVTVDSGITSVVSLAESPTTDEFYGLFQGSGDATLYHSTNGGATWSALSVTGNYTNVAVDPSDANIVVVVGNSDSVISTGGSSGTFSNFNAQNSSRNDIAFLTGKICKGNWCTADQGTTWDSIQDPAGDVDLLGPLVEDPSSSTTWYIGTNLGCAKTTDSGSTWTDTVTGLFGVPVNDIAQATNKDIVYLAAYSGVAKTTNFTDSEPTWSYPMKLGNLGGIADAVEIIDPSSPDTVLAASGSIYKTTDGGSTWTEKSSPSGNVFDFVVDGSGNIYAGFGDTGSFTGGVLKSTDDGETWTDISSGSFDAPVNTVDVIGTSIFAGVGSENDSTATKRGIYKYDGSTWTQLSGDIAGKLVNDLLVVSTDLYAAGGETSSGGVYKSTDSGSTWTDLEVMHDNAWFTALAADPSTGAIYAAHGRPAGETTIYESTDSGTTWSTYYEGLKDEAPAAMLFDDLTAGFNTGLFEFGEDDGSSSSYSCTLKFIPTKSCKKKVKKGTKCKAQFLLKNATTKAKISGATVTFGKKKVKDTTYTDWSKTYTTKKSGKAKRRVPTKKKMDYRAQSASPYSCTATKRMKVVK